MALLAIILSLCLVCKMLNVHFLEIMATLMMTMTTENHLAMPPLPLFYLPFTPTTSKKTAPELLEAATKCHIYLSAASDTVGYSF